MAMERASTVVAVNETLHLNNTLQAGKNFSSGMRALGKYIHGKNLLYGIYESSGTKTCQKFAGTLGNEWIDAQTFAAWEVDYVKYDDCYHEQYTEPTRYPGDMPPILRYPLMGQALNRTGRKMNYMCNFPWQLWGMHGNAAMGGAWTSEFCNSWRTCGDPGPGFASSVGYVDCWEKWADAIPSGPGGFATLDAMEVGNGGMTTAQQQAVFSLYGLIKTPLYIGADVTTLTGTTLEVYLNKDIIAWNQDALGKPGRQIRKNGDSRGELWGGQLSGGNGAAVLLNRGAKVANVSLTWAEIGVKESAATVTDAWSGKVTKVSCLPRTECRGAGVTALVAPHSAVALTVRPIIH